MIISSSGSDGYDEAEEEERLKCKWIIFIINILNYIIQLLFLFLYLVLDEEGIDYTKIDFESRRMKARRAHEEVISRRYRQPNLMRRK